VAQDSALAANVSAMPVARARDYDSFVAALAIAKAAACRAAGLAWAVQPGLSIMATVPVRWVSCKIFGGTSRAPRDQRLPAPRFWPGGALPAGAVVVVEGPRESAPLVFADWQAPKNPAYYRAKMQELGWRFAEALGGGGWRRIEANDASATMRGAA
jgi:hypothetical protein